MLIAIVCAQASAGRLLTHISTMSPCAYIHTPTYSSYRCAMALDHSAHASPCAHTRLPYDPRLTRVPWCGSRSSRTNAATRMCMWAPNRRDLWRFPLTPSTCRRTQIYRGSQPSLTYQSLHHNVATVISIYMSAVTMACVRFSVTSCACRSTHMYMRTRS